MNLKKWEILLSGSKPDVQNYWGHMVKESYGGRNAIEVETALFLYALVRRYCPKTIVETGTHMGFSSACMALALEDLARDVMEFKSGKVVTVDIGHYLESRLLWAKLELEEWIIPLVGDSSTIAYWHFEPIDMLLLDADHGEDFVCREFFHFLPYFRKKRTLVLFHDTVIDPRESKAIQWILTENPQLKESYRMISHFPFRNLRGFDMLLLSNEDL